MKGSRYSEEQIVGVRHKAEAGLKTAEVYRRHGIAEATLYKWKAKYGVIEMADANRLKEPRRREPAAEEAAGRSDAG